MMDHYRYKEAAVSFLKMTSSGKVREAYAQFVRGGFRHHNPYFEGSAESPMAGMEENVRQFPDKALEVKQVIAEGDRVVVHARGWHKPNDSGLALGSLFLMSLQTNLECSS